MMNCICILPIPVMTVHLLLVVLYLRYLCGVVVWYTIATWICIVDELPLDGYAPLHLCYFTTFIYVIGVHLRRTTFIQCCSLYLHTLIGPFIPTTLIYRCYPVCTSIVLICWHCLPFNYYLFDDHIVPLRAWPFIPTLFGYIIYWIYYSICSVTLLLLITDTLPCVICDYVTSCIVVTVAPYVLYLPCCCWSLLHLLFHCVHLIAIAIWFVAIPLPFDLFVCWLFVRLPHCSARYYLHTLRCLWFTFRLFRCYIVGITLHIPSTPYYADLHMTFCHVDSPSPLPQATLLPDVPILRLTLYSGFGFIYHYPPVTLYYSLLTFYDWWFCYCYIYYGSICYCVVPLRYLWVTFYIPLDCEFVPITYDCVIYTFTVDCVLLVCI